MSRMEQAAAGSVLRILGDASFERVLRRVGPHLFFDASNPSGHYVLRLDRRGDRSVLAQLFEIAANSSKDRGAGRDDDNKTLQPGFGEITLVGLQGLCASSPPAAAEAARALRAKALAARAAADNQLDAAAELALPASQLPGPAEPPGTASDGCTMLKYLHQVLLLLDPFRVAAAPFAPAVSASGQQAHQTGGLAHSPEGFARAPGARRTGGGDISETVGSALTKASVGVQESPSMASPRSPRGMPTGEQQENQERMTLLESREGLSLPAWLLRELCKRGRHANVARLRHWSAAQPSVLLPSAAAGLSAAASASTQGAPRGGEGQPNPEEDRKGWPEEGNNGQDAVSKEGSLVIQVPSRVTQEQRLAIEGELAVRGVERRQNDALGAHLGMRQEGALASVMTWLACLPLPPPLPPPAAIMMELEKEDSESCSFVRASDPQLGSEMAGLGEQRDTNSHDRGAPGLSGVAANTPHAMKKRWGTSYNSEESSDGSDDGGEAETPGADADEEEDVFGLGNARVKDVPSYMQLNRDPLAPPYPTADEIDGWRQQVMGRWLPRKTMWEEMQERPYKPVRSYRAKTKYVGAPLAVEFKPTDVLHVVFHASLQHRLTKVVERVNAPNALRVAQLQELSGHGFGHQDYRATFLWRMLPHAQPPNPASEDKSPNAAHGHAVGRKAKEHAAAQQLMERKRDVQGIDIQPPPGPAKTDSTLVTDSTSVRTAPQHRWERKVFLISEIQGAAAAAAATASWRGGGFGGRGLKRSGSRDSLASMLPEPPSPLDADEAWRNLTHEQRQTEERLKALQEREEEKRAVLGVHYLDDTGTPKLLFPLSGIEAVRILPSPLSDQGAAAALRAQEEDEDCSHLTHLCHPVPTHINILVSVCYDDESLPLWYAANGSNGSQQAAGRLDSPDGWAHASNAPATLTPGLSAGSKEAALQPGSGAGATTGRGARGLSRVSCAASHSSPATSPSKKAAGAGSTLSPARPTPPSAPRGGSPGAFFGGLGASSRSARSALASAPANHTRSLLCTMSEPVLVGPSCHTPSCE